MYVTIDFNADPSTPWQDRVLAATRRTMTGMILRCVLDRNEAKLPKLVGKAAVNSDDDVVCDFIDPDGNYCKAALIAPLCYLEASINKLIEVYPLNPEEAAALRLAVTRWLQIPLH
jgi:hypothetical protein